MTPKPEAKDTPPYRQEVWDYLKDSQFRCLIEIAKLQAQAEGGSKAGQARKRCQLCVGQKCPQPMNFLLNATPPEKAPAGLAGQLPEGFQLAGALTCLKGIPAGTPVFNGCNFEVLQKLAEVKHGETLSNPAPDQLRGFGLHSSLGLSILLGPWADYCLWCWSQHPSLGEGVPPTVIFGKDNSCFADETITAGKDWGAEQVHDTAKISSASGKPSDKSSRVLFGAIKSVAAESFKLTIEEFIARKRILVCNVWPWFRCGLSSSGDAGIHSDFSTVKLVTEFAQGLVGCLTPAKVGCLGSWTAPNASKDSERWVRKELLGLPVSSASPKIAVFPHPSASTWKSSEAVFQAFIQ